MFDTLNYEVERPINKKIKLNGRIERTNWKDELGRKIDRICRTETKNVFLYNKLVIKKLREQKSV